MYLPANIVAGLSYLFGWISALIALVLNRNDSFVRFHAMQSLLLFGGVSVLYVLIYRISYFLPYAIASILESAANLIGLVAFITGVVLAIAAFQGRTIKVFKLGDLAEKCSDMMRY